MSYPRNVVDNNNKIIKPTVHLDFEIGKPWSYSDYETHTA